MSVMTLLTLRVSGRSDNSDDNQAGDSGEVRARQTSDCDPSDQSRHLRPPEDIRPHLLPLITPRTLDNGHPHREHCSNINVNKKYLSTQIIIYQRPISLVWFF